MLFTLVWASIASFSAFFSASRRSRSLRSTLFSIVSDEPVNWAFESFVCFSVVSQMSTQSHQMPFTRDFSRHTRGNQALPPYRQR